MKRGPAWLLATVAVATVAVVAACANRAPAAPSADAGTGAGAGAGAGAGTGAGAAAGAGAGAGSDDDCTLATPLVPGIPGSPGNLIQTPRNPNGASELAMLMRQFVDDLDEVRADAMAGRKPKPLFATHRKMRCSWHTDPAERNQRFDTFAQSYLAAVRQFDAEPTRQNYNAIVNGCVHCHSQSCGGPLDFIDTKRWQN
jgi:hypothetical protein